MQPHSLSAIFFSAMLLRFCSFCLVILTCSTKLSKLSKMTPTTLTLDFPGIGVLLIVRCGSNLASLLQLVGTDALDFSADTFR